MQKFKVAVIGVFFFLIIIPMILFNWEENYISEMDNRELMNNPFGPNYIRTEDSDLTYDIETYVQDRIGLRTEMVYAYTVLNDILFDEMVSTLYTEGKDGYVFSNMSPNIEFNSYHITFADMIEEIQTYCEERNVPFVFVFDPSKTTVLQEYLPEGVDYDASWVDSFMDELDKRDINYVNNTTILKEKEDAGESVFNKKFDANHWNDLGAFYGVNNILENLRTFYPSLRLNEKSEFEITRELNTMLLQSMYPINEYSPYFSLKNSEAIEDITGVYSDEVELDPDYRHFQYTVNEAAKENGSPKTLVFQGSYMNEKGAKFLQNSLGEYIAIHDYQNVIDFDYYFNLFQPDCVVFEVAEYTLREQYFDSTRMSQMKLNPTLSSFEDVKAEHRELSSLEIEKEEGTAIEKITVKGLDDNIDYVYIEIDGNIYDLKKAETEDCYEVSIEAEREGNINSVITISNDGTKHVYIP